MKFNPNLPHGTTYGDQRVAHVQNGIEFGFDGLPIVPEQSEPSADRSAKMKEIWKKRKERSAADPIMSE